MEIRPSVHHFTAVLEVLRHRSMYVDLGLLKQHDIRTARCNRWSDNIIQNGHIVWREIQGPSDIAAWDGGWGVFMCSMLMANACLPPHIEAYQEKFRKHVGDYPECYALAYQSDDRFRHEIVPELLRTETNKYEKRIAAGWWPGQTDDASVLNPEEPWNHILHMMVKGAAEVQWWTDNFTFKAQAIVHKVKSQAILLDGDAPIGCNKVGALDLRPPPAATPYGTLKAPKNKANGQQPQAEATHHPHAWSANGDNKNGPRLSNKKSGRAEICKQFNEGKCQSVNASGQCGEFSCAKRSWTIHACSSCGQPGHSQQDCPQMPGKKPKTAPTPAANTPTGKGGKAEHKFVPTNSKGKKGKKNGKKGGKG